MWVPWLPCLGENNRLKFFSAVSLCFNANTLFFFKIAFSVRKKKIRQKKFVWRRRIVLFFCVTHAPPLPRPPLLCTDRQVPSTINDFPPTRLLQRLYLCGTLCRLQGWLNNCVQIRTASTCPNHSREAAYAFGWVRLFKWKICVTRLHKDLCVA